MHTNYRGGRPRDKRKHYTSQCIVCGAVIPDERWQKLTCDETCERARKTKRTREEQFWRDYNDDKVTIK